MAATYTKLKNGEWGIRCEGAARKGDLITVTKKSGETKNETVTQVLWSGNGITLCAISQRSAREPSSDRGSSRQAVERLYRRKYGWDGRRDSPSYYSSGMYDEES